MSVVDVIFLVFLVVGGGYFALPLVRGRCAVLQAPALRVMLGAFLVLVATELLTRSLLVDDRNAAAVVATAVISGVILAFGAVGLGQIKGWLVLNYDVEQAQHVAVRTLSLLGYAYRMDGRQINLSHPAGLMYIRPVGPRCVRVRFYTPHESPRFRLFVSGYRKQLMFQPVRNRLESISLVT